MNKELEALEQLFQYSKSVARLSNSQSYEDRKIIKSALERKEKLENAWKIIDEHAVDIFGVSRCNTVGEYNVYQAFENWQQLTETEFSLLKEMLEEK